MPKILGVREMTNEESTTLDRLSRWQTAPARQAVVATDPKVIRWHIVCDNLNIHQSEALVRWVADISDIQENLGKKGEYGILALMPRRATFLSDPSHKVVFHDTPNHSSWLNQIEI